jgi:hypothetical protein
MPSRRPRAAVAAATLLLTLPLSQAHAADTPGQQKPGHHSFAVIGDMPYGPAEIAAFPGKVDRINADDDLAFTVHVGDTKNGSSLCTDEYNDFIRHEFDRFAEPLVYTPGDNEWTDCHRPAAGGYDPLERLAAIRATFFSSPGRTLGLDPMAVTSQAALGVPENVSFRRQGLAMATLHVVGSNNDLAPWSGLGLTAPTAEQVAEERQRMDATVDLVRETFAGARRRNDRAVVLFQQADMFDPTITPTPATTSAFDRLVAVIAEESRRFAGEVYLVDGDSHRYNVDRPLATGSPWLTHYGVTAPADNLTRITVDGEALATTYLKVTVNRPGAARVLSWERIPYAS